MKNFRTYIILLMVAFSMQTIIAQEKIDYWKYKIEEVKLKEKQLLKIEIDNVNKMLSENKIGVKEAEELRVEAKRKSDIRLMDRITAIEKRKLKLKADGLKITIKGKDTLIQKTGKKEIIYNNSHPTVKQGNSSSKIIVALQRQKEKIKLEEKEALKKEIEAINKRLDAKEITFEEAKKLKSETAKKRALNIENKQAIIDNKIALLERGETINEINDGFIFSISSPFFKGEVRDKKPRKVKYDKRTYSDLVMAVGLNNAIIEGQSLEDSPYKIGGSRFFELGLEWRTRVFKNTNFLRLHYGFSFQFNGLKPVDNQYFIRNGDEPELQEFPLELNKSKLRTDNLVFPLHFEFGPSNKFFYSKSNSLRYSTAGHFKLGLGGYGGFNLGARQKLKYKEDGKKQKDKLKGGYNTSSFVYGLSAYAGFGHIQLYVKYDLSPIFKDAVVEQNNISLGLRFSLD